MENNFEIIELFPTPVYTTQLSLELTQLISWFDSQNIISPLDTMYGGRSKDSYILDNFICNNLKESILSHTLNFGKQLGYKYDEYKPSQSWLSYKYPNQSHTTHTHQNSLISGVFYYDHYPPDYNLPNIQFQKYSLSNSLVISPSMISDEERKELKYSWDYTQIIPCHQLLLLFPSSLPHSVPLNTTNKVRKSLAFNIVPKVGFGNEDNLTELKF